MSSVHGQRGRLSQIRTGSCTCSSQTNRENFDPKYVNAVNLELGDGPLRRFPFCRFPSRRFPLPNPKPNA